MYIGNVSDNVIGGTEIGAGNLISGNNFGIRILRASERKQVQGNLIGTDLEGMDDIGNNLEGVRISDGAGRHGICVTLNQ